MEKGTQDVSARYPAAYRRLYAYFSEHKPSADSPVAASRLVGETGFITREAVIRKILQNVDWAAETERGYFAWADPSSAKVLSAPARTGSGGAAVRFAPEAGPGGSIDAGMADSGLADKARVVLKKESEHNRIGVSLTYLKRLCGNPPDGDLLRILSEAPWVKKQYGMYRYEEIAAESGLPAEGSCEQIAMDITGIPPVSGNEEERDIPAAGNRKESADRTPKAPRDGGAEASVQLSMQIPDDGREELRVGTVLKVKKKKHAKTGWASVDFGADFGKADARIPAGHLPENLSGKQVVCAVGWAEGKKTARVLYVDTERGAVTVGPAEAVRNGDRAE